MSVADWIQMLWQNNPAAAVMLAGFAGLFLAAWYDDIRERSE